MKGYRYNAKNREDRLYNTCGREKNPNGVQFYARTLEFAEAYRYIYNNEGEIEYECTLEVIELPQDIKLFDMANFSTLKTYKKWMDSTLAMERKENEYYLSKAKTKKDKKFWENQIAELSTVRVAELQVMLKNTQFQSLSDFELQNALISELREKGYQGYITTKEIAIWEEKQ